MGLSGQQRKKLQEALIDAFPTSTSLEQMLSYELNKNLRVIAGEGSLQDIVFKLIQAADSQGWVVDLVRAARKENPGNSELEALSRELFPIFQAIETTNRRNQVLNEPNKKAQQLIIYGFVVLVITVLGTVTVKLLSKNQPNENQAEYAELENSLRAKNWQGADVHTSQLMLNIAKTKREENLDINSISSFSCPDLRKIDYLWVAYSNKRFGFSVQKEIWIKTGNPVGIIDQQSWTGEKIENWSRFVTAVGWYDRSKKPVRAVESIKNYNGDSPRGYFPYWVSGAPYSWGGHSSAVMQRVAECNL